MNPNMCIYRQLNPRLLVQVGLGLGILHWANICLIYISNTFPQTQSGSSMKAWGWISMRRSLWRCLEECLWKNHNEEYANWPILEFQMKKQSPKLESTRKTEQDRPFRKFWLLVKGQRKVKANDMVKVNGQEKSTWFTIWVDSGFSGRVTDRLQRR